MNAAGGAAAGVASSQSPPVPGITTTDGTAAAEGRGTVCPPGSEFPLIMAKASWSAGSLEMGAKFAVTALEGSAEKLCGLAGPETAPLKPVNRKPGFACASTRTV